MEADTRNGSMVMLRMAQSTKLMANRAMRTGPQAKANTLITVRTSPFSPLLVAIGRNGLIPVVLSYALIKASREGEPYTPH